MSTQEQEWFQAIQASQFNPASLTGTFQLIFASGFPDNIKIMEVYNGSAVAMDYSFDGTTLHGVWPAGATLIIHCTTTIITGHNPPTGSGSSERSSWSNNVWVKRVSLVNPTYLTIGGYR